nr:cytidine/deoxycytidylate deaminase family protein [Mycoplasma sp. NEAQ87857]
MLLAKTSAFRSKDPNTQVGACIINDKKRVIALGYNGMPQGLDKIFPWDRDKEEGLNKYPYVIHAEINAILNATVSVDQGILYTSLFPCSNCAKTIVQSGIKEIVYESNKYQGTTDQKIAQFIFDQTNVKTRQHLANPRITVKLD